jgi:hypothetical protein
MSYPVSESQDGPDCAGKRFAGLNRVHDNVVIISGTQWWHMRSPHTRVGMRKTCKDQDDGDDDGDSGGGLDMVPVSVSSLRRVVMQSNRLRVMFGSEVLMNTGTKGKNILWRHTCLYSCRVSRVPLQTTVVLTWFHTQKHNDGTQLPLSQWK